MIVLEHILVPAHDKEVSGRFLAHILGLEYLGLGSTAGAPVFARARVGAVTLDFADRESFETEHCSRPRPSYSPRSRPGLRIPQCS